MRLIFSPGAVKALMKLPKKEATALMEKMQQVAADPNGAYPWAKRLTGTPGFRIRQGDWRAVYRLDFETGTMIVEKIAKREEAYR